MSSRETGSSGEPPSKVAKRETRRQDDAGASTSSESLNSINNDSEHNRKTLSKLECPVCLHPMQPPIFTCATGHSFCNECEPQLQKCPICPADKTKIRSFGLEGMTDDIYFPCRGRGCEKRYLLHEKSAHSSECVGRIIGCWKEGCEDWGGTAPELAQHVSETHDADDVDLDTFNYEEYDVTNFENEDFYCFCVFLYGTKSEAAKYQFVVEVEAADDDGDFNSTHRKTMHCDLDESRSCCIPLFAKDSDSEKLIMEREKTTFELSYKIVRKVVKSVSNGNA